MDHLHALKRYLLMGRGDFALCLMDATTRVESSCKYNLSSSSRVKTGTCHTIILCTVRWSFDLNDSMWDFSSHLRERGWDIFLLDYSIQPVSGQGSTTRTPLVQCSHRCHEVLSQSLCISVAVEACNTLVVCSVFYLLTYLLSLTTHSLTEYETTNNNNRHTEESYTCCQERSCASGVKQCRTQVYLHHEMHSWTIHNTPCSKSWKHFGRVVQRNANRKRFRQCDRSSWGVSSKGFEQSLGEQGKREVRGLLNRVDLIVRLRSELPGWLAKLLKHFERNARRWKRNHAMVGVSHPPWKAVRATKRSFETNLWSYTKEFRPLSTRADSKLALYSSRQVQSLWELAILGIPFGFQYLLRDVERSSGASCSFLFFRLLKYLFFPGVTL